MRTPAAVLISVFMLALARCAPPEPVPGQTTADLTLQSDVRRLMLLSDRARAKGCSNRKIVNTLNVELAPDHHTERWVVSDCGTLVNYLVTYTTASDGGTMFEVRPEIGSVSE